jgi:hypothetical protein
MKLVRHLGERFVFEEIINGSPVRLRTSGAEEKAVSERAERFFAGLRETGNRNVSAPIAIEPFL